MKDNINKPLIKCILTETGGNSLDVSDYIDEWENLEIVMSRDGLSDVLTETSFPINLIGKGKDFIKDVFSRKGLYGEVILEVYRREEMSNEYSLIKEMPIDFSTYKEYDERVTVESSKSELIELINSEGKTKYDIPVLEVKDEIAWKYERINFVNNASYEIANDVQFKATASWLTLTMSLSNSELIPGEEVEFRAQEFEHDSVKPKIKSYFVESRDNEEKKISIDFGGMSISGTISKLTPIDKNPFLQLSIYKYNRNDLQLSNATSIMSWAIPVIWDRANGTFDAYIFASIIDVSLFKDERLCFGITTTEQTPYSINFKVKNFKHFTLKYIGKSKNVMYVDVVSPAKLLQRYIDEMTGIKDKYTSSISWDEDVQIMIVASESIRQINDANIHGSPNDFFDWMRVLGYEYSISDTHIRFKKRELFYQKNSTSMRLGIDDVADLIIQADGKHAYTSVKIGYKKQNYDTLNGRCEANGTYEYTTGYITRDDNKLSLISPYRADSIGIELLCQEADKKTTDKDSDNDIFFVALKHDSGSYKIDYSGNIKDENTGLEMFNWQFNPYYLVKRNESMIGINAKVLKFKSTDMNRTAVIIQSGDKINPYQDHTISSKLFTPVEYNFASGYIGNIMPIIKNGVVEFEYNGTKYRGFIKEIRKNYAVDTETTWILWKSE